MNIRKIFLSRVARPKRSTPAKPEEGAYEIPPPSAIEPGASYSEHQSEVVESGYGPHIELELLASGESPRTDSANGAGAEVSGHAPAPESSPQPISDEPPDAQEPPRQLEMHEEYGLELELLTEPEPDESPDAPESLEEDEEAASGVGEIVAEASETTPVILEESEPEAIVDAVPEFEEFPAVAESDVEAPESEPEITEGIEPKTAAELIQENEEPLAASVSSESPDESEPSHDPEPFEGYGAGFEALAVPETSESPDAPESIEEHEEAVSGVGEIVAEASESTPAVLEESEPEAIVDAVPAFEEVPALAESVVEAPESEPEIAEEIEPEAAVEIVQEDEEPLPVSESNESPDEAEPLVGDEDAASSVAENAVEAAAHEPKIFQESELEAVTAPPQAQPEESPETSSVENGFYPLVRNARGNWRPGKGFSRSELEAAGLSIAEAARLRIRFDKRRRNAHPMNVETLEKAKSSE